MTSCPCFALKSKVCLLHNLKIYNQFGVEQRLRKIQKINCPTVGVHRQRHHYTSRFCPEMDEVEDIDIPSDIAIDLGDELDIARKIINQ